MNTSQMFAMLIFIMAALFVLFVIQTAIMSSNEAVEWCKLYGFDDVEFKDGPDYCYIEYPNGSICMQQHTYINDQRMFTGEMICAK